MKMIRKILAALVVLSMLCVAACAEDIYWDSTIRVPNLYEETTATFNNYLSITMPSNWNSAEISDADSANGILAEMADDLNAPTLKVTVSTYTADECSNIFGGTGYDAIFESVSRSCTDTASVKINDIWTVLYSMNDGVKNLVIINIPMADDTMYQIRFEVYSITAIDTLNNIMKSVQSAQ